MDIELLSWNGSYLLKKWVRKASPFIEIIMVL